MSIAVAQGDQIETYCSGGGITLAELAFTRIADITLKNAFEKEKAAPLGLTKSGYFQPLDEARIANAAFGGMLDILEDRKHGYHYYPENAAAGFWTTPTKLARIGIPLSNSVRSGGLLRQETAARMIAPIMDNKGIGIFRWSDHPDPAGHSGWNRGLLTEWRFSRTKDLCMAAMINKSTATRFQQLVNVSSALFSRASERISSSV